VKSEGGAVIEREPREFAVPPAAPLAPQVLRGELKRNEPMARHVTWRAGGSVDLAYQPADLTDLHAFLRSSAARPPLYFVGLGSNLLVRDGGLRGTVVFTHRALSQLRLDAERQAWGEITAQAGVPAPKLARYAALHDLVGAEFYAGIPGTIGGALAMNAGCYGGETWRTVVAVATIDASGNVRERRPDEYEVGYRSVVAKRPADGEWFTGATFRFPRGEGASSRQLIKAFLQRRIATQPLGEPNAGSVFRNPPGDYAARLIEACGLKGMRIGGAMISDKHANFIVNRGGATARDIEALIALAREAVQARYGMVLETEVRIIGEPPATGSTGL
jgi:UDP-N-acetylmuramate dehydrogenase